MILLIDSWADIDRLNVHDALSDRFFLQVICCKLYFVILVPRVCDYLAAGQPLPLPGLVQATSPPLLVISFLDGIRQNDLHLERSMSAYAAIASTAVWLSTATP